MRKLFLSLLMALAVMGSVSLSSSEARPWRGRGYSYAPSYYYAPGYSYGYYSPGYSGYYYYPNYGYRYRTWR